MNDNIETIFDYLRWRGDLKLSQSGFNNVDALILALFSYLPFETIVPEDHHEHITIKDAADLFFDSDEAIANVFLQQDIELLETLSQSERFKDMKLSGYVNQIEFEIQKQFSAITITLDEDLFFIAYRGTDNTLVAWKENFNMVFMSPIPAQEQALDYLNCVSTVKPGNFIVGGHSKGGNLAVYASAFCDTEVQNRIMKIYNFDGPGFDSSKVSQLCFYNIREKIFTYVPQSSIIGLLLEREEGYHIVNSGQIGILQHDLYSWQVNYKDFVYVTSTTRGSKYLDKTLKDWVAQLEPNEREQFLEAIYSIFVKTNAKTWHELNENWYVSAQTILKTYALMDESFKQVIYKSIGAFLQTAAANFHMIKPSVFEQKQIDQKEV